MNRTEVAVGVAERLFIAERKLDEAFAAFAELAAHLPAARQGADLGIKVGVGAVSSVAVALGQLAAVRQTVADAHDQFAVVQRAIGVRTAMTGGGDKPPSPDEASLAGQDAVASVRYLRPLDAKTAAG